MRMMSIAYVRQIVDDRMENLVLFSHLAALTTRMSLVTSVLVLPQRRAQPGLSHAQHLATVIEAKPEIDKLVG
jgi:hypothetical protein